MKEENGNIDYDLIAKYLADELEAIERQAFEERLKESAELQTELNSIREIWEIAAEPQLEVDTDRAWNKVSKELHSLEENVIPINGGERSKAPVWWAIAAGIALIAGIASFWPILFNQADMLEISTTTAMATVVLPDGTSVSIGPASTLRYPESFNEEHRNVKLEGLAYFEVTKDAERPFTVQTKQGDVRVLGTAFEVDARLSDQLIVEVNEGKVAVSNEGEELNAQVTAGETCQLNLSESTIAVDQRLEPDAFYWKDKIIRFRRSKLSKVAEVLNQLLGIEVIIGSPAIQDCRLTATFKDESPEDILAIIASTLNLEVTKTDSGYQLSGEGC